MALPALFLAVPGTATASALKPGLSPQAVAWFGAPPTCPSAAAVDGREAAQAARDLLTGKKKVSSGFDDLDDDGSFADASRSFVTSLAVASLTITPAAVVTVCDPAVAASGQPLGSITGDARDVPETEQIGAGLRSRGGTFGRATAAAAIGDRFVLPAAGAGSLIDVAVDTVNGAATTRIGPVGAVPTAVRVAGQLEAPQVVVDYADGSSSTHPVAPPSATKTTVSAETSKDRLVLTVKAAPGAFVSSTATDPTSTDSMDAFSDPADLQLVSASGAVTVRLGPLSSGMTAAAVEVVDPDRRAIDTWGCKLRWSKTSLRSVTCAGGPDTSERPRVGSPKLGLAARATATAGARPRAHAAKAPLLAPIAASAIFRGRDSGDADLEATIEETDPLFADLTGDGRPESRLGDGILEPAQLLVSAPDGRWTTVKLRAPGLLSPSLSAAGDLNGDGVGELWATDVDGNARALAGTPAWSTTPPKALDVRTDIAGPRDLLVSGDVLPVPLIDTTADGRPELALPLTTSVKHAGIATFASNDAPLGQRLTVPGSLQTDPAGLWDYVANVSSAQELAVYDPDSATLVTPDGLVTVAPVADAAGTQRQALVRLSPDGRTLSPLPGFTLVAAPRLEDVDPATGELLVTTAGEACKKRRSCVSRVLRLDGTGKTIAGLAYRGSGTFTAHFVDDGPDADQRAEVVFRDDEDYGPRSKGTTPGTARSIARWDSATGSPALRTLPVLAVGGQAIRAHGPLLGWTSRAGKHHVGTWALRGKGKKRSFVLLDLTTPK